jgi:hypothetical protein
VVALAHTPCPLITLEPASSLICDAVFMDSLGAQFESSFMASGSAPWQFQVSDAAHFYAAADQLPAGYKRSRGPASDLQASFNGG